MCHRVGKHASVGPGEAAKHAEAPKQASKQGIARKDSPRSSKSGAPSLTLCPHTTCTSHRKAWNDGCTGRSLPAKMSHCRMQNERLVDLHLLFQACSAREMLVRG